MNRTREAILLLAFVVLLAASTSQGQATRCDPSLTPTGDTLGYQEREFRCEGLYEALVSSSTFQIMSVTVGRIAFSFASREPVRISSALQPARKRLNVRAVGLYPGTYYRMDTVMKPDSDIMWPVHEVLEPLQLSSDRIGIYGWYDTDEHRVFVPVRALQPGDTLTSDRVTLLIRPAVELEVLRWRQTIDDAELGAWSEPVALAYGQLFSIDLLRRRGRHRANRCSRLATGRFDLVSRDISHRHQTVKDARSYQPQAPPAGGGNCFRDTIRKRCQLGGPAKRTRRS